MKRAMALTIAAMLALSLCACGSNSGSQAESNAQKQAYDPAVESIDLSLEDGTLRFVRAEKADPGLTDEDNAFVFVFDFTNSQSTPESVQSVFSIQFFQNGAELGKSPSYSSRGGSQYELVGAFFDSALKDGTIQFGKIVIPEDDSPITIVAKPNGKPTEDNYQTMEVSINPLGNPGQPTTMPTSDEINTMLQGSWKLGDSAEWTFDQGSLTCNANGTVLTGTYEVDTDNSAIVGHISASDGTVKVNLPYTFDAGVLTIFNNEDEALVKQ